MSTYGAPQYPVPPQKPKRKGMHPLAITGIVLGSLLVLCCLGAGAFVLLSDDDTEPTTQDEPAPGQPADGDGDAAPGVGDPARDGKFEFVVTEIETGVDSVGDEFLGKEAQGQFVLVHMTIENIGDEAQLFDGSSQYLMDADGREHSSDGEAAFYVENSDSFLNEINPGNQVEGIVVFDIPAEAVPAGLRLHDSPFSGGVEVDLG